MHVFVCVFPRSPWRWQCPVASPGVPWLRCTCHQLSSFGCFIFSPRSNRLISWAFLAAFFFFSRLGSFVQHPHRHGNLAAALPALVFTPSVSGGNGRSRRLDCTSLSSAFHTRSRYWNEWDCLVRFVVIRRACSILYPLEFFPKMSHPHPSTPLHCYVTWWNDCYLIDDLFPCFYTVADKLFCTLPVEPSMHVPT